MRILVTNDDGIHAPGIAILETLAAALSDDVWTVAPLEEKSGAGHSLTLTEPLRAFQLEPRRFAVRGTPTDAVMLGLGKLVPGKRPDLVLSGVNRGGNLAEDVTYSGTVSAAMEGCLAGVPSIALSQSIGDWPGSDASFDPARAHGVAVIKSCLEAGWPAEVLLNINFPPATLGPVAGMRVTEQGFRDLGHIRIEERRDPRGIPYFWFGLTREISEPGHETDLKAMRERCVSITPLHLDLTHRQTLSTLWAQLDRRFD
jgi:5'-nucleotidase